MPVFTFSGKDASGQKISGERNARQQTGSGTTIATRADHARRDREKGKEFSLPTFGSGKVKVKDIAIFFRQFSVMIDAGLPLVQCLEILAANQENQIFQKTLTGVRTTVEGGATLANAMRQYPAVFDDLTTNMIEAGETGGILDVILQRSGHLRGKGCSPEICREIGTDLSQSPSSAWRRSLSALCSNGWCPFFPICSPGLGVAPAASYPYRDGPKRVRANFLVGRDRRCGRVGFWPKQIRKHPRGRYYFDKMLLNMPIIGSLLRKIAVGRFTRTFGTLITSGVPILEGLAITARTSGNAVLEEALMKVRKAIEEGRTIVDPLRECGVFPNMVTQMIGVGEATGAMDNMLQKIADFYEEEVDAATKDMLAMLEPAIIGVLGVTVGGIVISLYMPLFAMIAKLAG